MCKITVQYSSNVIRISTWEWLGWKVVGAMHCRDAAAAATLTYILVCTKTEKKTRACRAPISRRKFDERQRDKTAELSQRRPRDVPNIWVPWKVLRVLTTHPATFPEICNRLLFRSILRMRVQKLKFVALPVPEIIGGTQKIWAFPVYAHAPFSPKFWIGFCSHGPSEYICQIWHS